MMDLMLTGSACSDSEPMACSGVAECGVIQSMS